VEAKAVNHRYADVVVRLPRTYVFLEEPIKRIFLNGIARGRVDIFVNFEANGETGLAVKVDKEICLRYYNCLKDLAEELELSFDVGVSQLFSLPAVVTVEEPEDDPEAVTRLVEEASRLALAGLQAMRLREGQALVDDLCGRLALFAQRVQAIETRAPFVSADHQERLQERLKELLGSVPVDQQRIAMEVALFADHASITEELVRLASHLGQFRKALQSAEPVGRKLDFLVQEMNREINTIGAKANDLEISRQVVELKSELEKIREQVQNIQ
ncbi:MAG: YicC family protein, partial [Heliobacteriaceae bacterium]|nr:YicC family protein [Heliobacteriaceae bacterium]